MNRSKRLRVVLLVAFAAFVDAFGAFASAPSRSAPDAADLGIADVAGAETRLVWREDIDAALAYGAANYQPVVALFSSSNCPWCLRLKNEVLADETIRGLLANFSLVEVDVTARPRAGAMYAIRGVPTLLILSSDGRPRDGAAGYVTVEALRPMLERALNPEVAKKPDAEKRELLKSLAADEPSLDEWKVVMIGLGRAEWRDELRGAIFARSPFPRRPLVAMLESPQLAVRLGALEILEDLQGDALGYNPWLDGARHEANADALKKWKTWSEEAATTEVRKVYAPLSDQEVFAYLEDLIGDNRERSARAARMLENGGPGVVKAVTEFLEFNPDLPEYARMKIKETQYALVAPRLLGVEPAVLAHRLVFGKLDARMEGLSALSAGGAKAVPILADFLDNDEAILREVAVDALVATGHSAAIGALLRRLEKETDADVVYTIVKGLGKRRRPGVVEALAGYLDSPNEDWVIAALESLTALKDSTRADEIANCLKDRRWRVRVAALKAVRELSLNHLDDEVAELLADEDEFVRYQAVETVAAISSRGARSALEKAYRKSDALKGPVVRAFARLEMDIPKRFIDDLEGKPPDVVMSVIDGLQRMFPPLFP